MANTNHIETLPKGLSFQMIKVEGGIFSMGNEAYKREQPVHQVNVPSFLIGQYPVTQQLWQAIMGDNPSLHKGELRPVENVSWDDAQRFIKQLNWETRKTFRLPTEAEWEYAARGGRYSQGFEYAGSDKLKQVGWYDENSDNETHDVGLLLSNELGVYDMSGNVWEWCEDDHHENYKDAPLDGSAWVDVPERGSHRVVRGGSYFDRAVDCRPTSRAWFTPDDRLVNIGFRLVLPLQSVG